MRFGHHHHMHGLGRRFARGLFRRVGDGGRHEHGEGHPGDGPHEHGRHGRHERGGRRARLFDHGELRLVVLALIAERPRHGYEIIKEVEDRTAGTYSPSPGVVYPTLTMLEELGHATVSEDGGKKQYAITPDGERLPGRERARRWTPRWAACAGSTPRMAAARPRRSCAPRRASSWPCASAWRAGR